MKGLDTNVLLRFVTADDPTQSPLAREFVRDAAAAGTVLHVSSVVLCEFAWTLRSDPYCFDRSEIAQALGRLLTSRVFRFQHRDLGVARIGGLSRRESRFR